MASASNNTQLLQQAMKMLNRSSEISATTELTPAGKCRNALELLANSTPENISETLPENMREFTEHIFDWDTSPGEQSKVTRPLIRLVSEILKTSGKYHQAVEGIAFAAAAAPLLDPNSVVELVKESITVDTAFAPERYTLQFSTALQKALGRYNNARRLKLLQSFWKEMHQGRWWDMTAGIRVQNVAGQVEEANVSQQELVPRFLAGNLPYTTKIMKDFTKLSEDARIVQFLEEYLAKFNAGVLVDPDITVFASGLAWLPVNKRPESPGATLVRSLVKWREIAEEHLQDKKVSSYPKKPTSFTELFPDIRLVDGDMFPLPLCMYKIDGMQLPQTNHILRLVKNSPELAQNRDYMGNCTWSYRGRMQDGKYALFQILDAGTGKILYNAAGVSAAGGSWKPGEINSRYNRGNVPHNVRESFKNVVSQLRDENTEFVNAVKGSKKTSKKSSTLRVGYRV